MTLNGLRWKKAIREKLKRKALCLCLLFFIVVKDIIITKRCVLKGERVSFDNHYKFKT